MEVPRIILSEVHFRIEKGEVRIGTLFGSQDRPQLTAVIITDQGLWDYQMQTLMKIADRYLKQYKEFCRKEYGWRGIQTNHIFRTSDDDARQARPEFYWDIPSEF